MGINAEKNIKYTVNEKLGACEMHISDEVLVVIAALAATEVDGVAEMSGGITHEIATRLGAGKLSKGVKVILKGNKADISVKIKISDGYEIPEITKKVQKNVKEAVETMTGLNVTAVNVAVTGVSVEKA